MDFLKSVYQFCLENWRTILIAGCSLIGLLVSLFRKKTKITTDGLTKVLMALPGYINEAESKFLNGERKFNYVFNLALRDLELVYSEEVIKSHGFASIITYAIEAILSTPEKKEVTK